MATLQTIQHFQKFSELLESPVLEIGSLIDPSYTQHKPLDIHQGGKPGEYIGVDIFHGEGVDHVINLCKVEELEKLPLKKFKTIHCHYVMEHVTDIFSMAKNIEALLDDGGVLLFSVPFSWRLHRIPVDMWRFTPQSIDYLFPNVEFIDEKSALSVRNGNKTFKIDQFPEFDFGSRLESYPGYIKWYVRLLRKLKLHNNVFNQRALLYETNLMMFGVKRNKPVYTYIDPQFV
ncbi:class I SAM-dependent methyltransferase [Polluticoccus soli]|uniref:class I SAM-dependent methyltransferase n=1 Tax=Polluticoccus soli TaxID=3034150 RepID=UPI0023E0BD27|nr:methyltransferase domain-containing protein [Flavipsychrobacter sp. JY13-12]